MPSEEREGKSNTVHGMMSEKCRRITVIEGRKSQQLEGKGGFGLFLFLYGDHQGMLEGYWNKPVEKKNSKTEGGKSNGITS